MHSSRPISPPHIFESVSTVTWMALTRRSNFSNFPWIFCSTERFNDCNEWSNIYCIHCRGWLRSLIMIIPFRWQINMISNSLSSSAAIILTVSGRSTSKHYENWVSNNYTRNTSGSKSKLYLYCRINKLRHIMLPRMNPATLGANYSQLIVVAVLEPLLLLFAIGIMSASDMNDKSHYSNWLVHVVNESTYSRYQ